MIMGKPENIVTNSIRKYLDSLGIYHWKHHQSMYCSKKGISDIIGIMPDGRLLAIEVKSAKGKPTDDQIDFLQAIDKCKGIPIIAYNVNDVVLGLATLDYVDPNQPYKLKSI